MPLEDGSSLQGGLVLSQEVTEEAQPEGPLLLRTEEPGELSVMPLPVDAQIHITSLLQGLCTCCFCCSLHPGI